MSLTAREAFQGFAEADSILAKLPILLRGRRLTGAVKGAMERLAVMSAAKTPREGASVGGVEYTPLRGDRASRTRLSQGISSVLRRYDGGQVIVGVAGPVKRQVGRHAHLVEFGFHHTTGGTFRGSGGRTRIAKRQAGLSLIQTRWKGKSGPREASRKFIAGSYFSRDRVRNLDRKFAVSYIRQTNAAKTGTGKRGNKIEARPFVLNTWQSNKAKVQQEIIAELQKFADDFAKREARKAARAAKLAAKGGG